MRTRRRAFALGAPAAAIALVLTLGSHAAYGATDTPPPADEIVSEQVGESVVVEDPVVDDAALVELQETGLDGQLIELQYDPALGSAAFIGDDGSWVIRFPLDGAVDPVPTGELELRQADVEALAAGDWGYGVCYGNFNHLKKLSNRLHWGGNSTCDGTPSSIYPHRLEMTLYNTCVGPFCAVLEQLWTAKSPTSTEYNRVVNAVRDTACLASIDRTYEQRAVIYAGGIQRGTAWERGVVITGCDVEPD